MKQDSFQKRAAVLGFLVLFTGCFHQQPYTYSDIRKEYADVICRISPLEGSPEGKESCGLNKPVTLTESIDIATANNPEKQMAVSRIKAAKAMLEQSKAAFYPFVGAYAEVMYGDAPSAYLFKTIDQRDLAPQTDFNDPGTITNFETGVSVKWNMYNGGKDLLTRQIAESEIETSIMDDQTVLNSLISAVIHAYYDAMAARDYIRIAEESVSTVETELKMVKIRYEGGGALKSDVLSLEVRLAQAKEDLLRSQNGYKMALTALARIMGVSPDNQFQVSEAAAPLVEIPSGYLEGVDVAMKRRSDIRKIREQVRQSRMALDLARTGYLPTVDFMTKFYADDDAHAYELDNMNWTAAVMMNWTIFSGYSVQAEEKKAMAAVERILAADRQAVLAVKSDVKNAYLKLEEAVARLEVAQKSVDMAEESLSLVRNQYEGGAAAVTRYLEAESDRNRARIRSTAAFYDKQKAYADIARAIGYWSDFKGIKSEKN